jgi:hypothetical protein
MKTSSTMKTNGKTEATISLSDFVRIRNSIVPPLTSDDGRKEFDATLKETSILKTRQWPDSIEMAKKNKLDSRKKVFFEKEYEKRRIEEEERKFQEAQKKMVIERANKLLFEAQDPVKSFHSKLLLSDVHKERDYQKEIRQRQKEIGNQIEQKHREMEVQNMREHDLKEKMKFEEEKRKKELQMNIINQQFMDFKIKKVKEYQEYIIEGEIVKLSAKKGLEEERKKEEERRSKAVEQQNQFKLSNLELLKMKEEIKQKEREEEKKIEEYAIKKTQISDLRRRKELEKIKEKQDQRQVLIDKQIEYLKNVKNRENDILDKQVKEAEEKKKRELEEKLKHKSEMKKQIDENRDLQIKRKKEVKDIEKKEDKDFIEQWKDKMKQLVNLILSNFY